MELREPTTAELLERRNAAMVKRFYELYQDEFVEYADAIERVAYEFFVKHSTVRELVGRPARMAYQVTSYLEGGDWELSGPNMKATFKDEYEAKELRDLLNAAYTRGFLDGRKG